MEIVHEEVVKDGELEEESFWVKSGYTNKIIKRDQMVAIYGYVKDHPEKFPEVFSK